MIVFRLIVLAAIAAGLYFFWPQVIATSSLQLLAAAGIGALVFAIVDAASPRVTKPFHLLAYSVAAIYAGTLQLILGRDNSLVVGVRESVRAMYLDQHRRYGDEFVYIRTRSGGKLEAELENVIKDHRESGDEGETETLAHNGFTFQEQHGQEQEDEAAA